MGHIFKFPVRVCHAGEDLDWLGYRCCCTAINLFTIAKIVQKGIGHRSDYLDAVYWYLRNIIPKNKKRPTIVVSSEAPIGSGLSTSTSLTLSLLIACLSFFKGDSINSNDLANMSYEIEHKISQGGGMDQLTIIEGSTLLMQGNGKGLPQILDRTSWPETLAIIIIDSRQKKSTKTHIRVVREQLNNMDVDLTKYINSMDDCACQIFKAIKGRNLINIQKILNEAHSAMRDLQKMSTNKLETLRDIALSVGCGGVKLTGAGGGGCLFSVVERSDREKLILKLKNEYKKLNLTARVLSPEVYDI